MGRFILSLALVYIVATGMGLSKANGADPGCHVPENLHPVSRNVLWMPISKTRSAQEAF